MQTSDTTTPNSATFGSRSDSSGACSGSSRMNRSTFCGSTGRSSSCWSSYSVDPYRTDSGSIHSQWCSSLLPRVGSSVCWTPGTSLTVTPRTHRTKLILSYSPIFPNGPSFLQRYSLSLIQLVFRQQQLAQRVVLPSVST